MRARRLLGSRRRLPQSKAQPPPAFVGKISVGQDDHGQTTRTSQSLPLPTVFSPRHPNSFRLEHGLYKYATSVVNASPSIKRSLDAKQAAFKVYSTSPLSSLACFMLQKLLAEDNHPPAANLGDALRHLYRITAKVHAALDSVKNVFFQAYRPPITLRPLRLPWTIVTPSSRQWNLSCEIYRTGTESGPSVPRICIALLTFDDGRAIQHGPWSKSANKIAVQIFADLKPSLLQCDAEEQVKYIDSHKSSQGFVQAIVDDILFAIAEVSAPRGFANPMELITKLKNAILSYLKNSALRPLANFQNLEIIIMDPNRQRYVSNILLSSDGSERYADDDNSVPDLPDLEEGNERHTPIKIESGSRVNHIMLSELTTQKIGFGEMSADVDSQLGLSIESLPITGAEFVQAFDKNCQDLEETGLVCCIKAARFLALQYNTVQGHLTPSRSYSVSSRAGTFDLRINYSRKSEQLVIHLPHCIKNVYLTDSRKTSVQILSPMLFYDLYEDPQQDIQDPNRSQNTAAGEISVLSRAFESISEIFLDNMKFQSYDEIPSRLAAAMLELLEVPSLGIALQTVKIDIKPVHDQEGMFRGRASRAIKQSPTLGRSDANLRPSSHALPRGIGDTTQSTISIGDVTEESRSLSHSQEDSHEELVVRRLRKCDVLFCPEWIPLRPLQRKTGFEKYRVMVTLPKSIRPRTDLTAERMNVLIQDALEASFRTDLSCFQPVLSRLSGLSTPLGSLTLQVRLGEYSASSEITMSGIRTGLEVTLQAVTSKSDGAPLYGPDALTVKLPAFKASIQLDKQELTPDTKAHLVYFLRGAFPQTIGHEMTATEQLSHLFLDVHRITTGILDSRSFTTFEELASHLANALLESRHEFSSTIDLHNVSLQASLRKGTYSQPPIAKTFAIRELELSAEAKEKSEVESPKSRPPEYGREYKLEEKAQPEVEAEYSEAGPRVLDPKYDVNASKEQSANQTFLGTIPTTVFVALGSNVGDRLGNIENACREMDSDPDIRIVRTSPLYETDPMYVSDQDRFLNGVCEIETKLEPMVLLDRLKAIEDRLGRVKTIEKGPRSIDLDILLYGNLSMTTDHLTIPHPLMTEREFVLRPLRDLRDTLRVEVGGSTVRTALRKLPKSTHPMHSFVPLGPADESLHATDPKNATRVMSILNTTPDSFSDGGDIEVADIAKLQQTIRSQIAAGATIIDIGGQSSRPNAPDVTAEEEIRRVLPAIEAIKSLSEAANVAISVDTYRAAVADAAIMAGAHIINDISAGKLDSDMFATIARLGCTYVMMHMRGTPATMMSEENCTYAGDLIDDIAKELAEQADRAQEAGIRRWRIILDPGIGFSKTPEQNMEILRRLPRFRWTRLKLSSYPWLVGTSRKSFIGKVTGVQEPKARVWGTSATVTAAVQGGADIVRVHDVEEMATVVKMADAMYRIET